MSRGKFSFKESLRNVVARATMMYLPVVEMMLLRIRS